jgi:glutathione S-transferase
VPMLEVDGLALVQTDAILRYLGESIKKKKV